MRFASLLSNNRAAIIWKTQNICYKMLRIHFQVLPILATKASQFTFCSRISMFMMQFYFVHIRNSRMLSTQPLCLSFCCSSNCKQFIEMIENNFHSLKLPKDYASLLNITPNQLNFVCQQQINLSAGEIIRRIILEAKRLLVSFDLSIANIAETLNYSEPSYFVKFFKKYTSFTP